MTKEKLFLATLAIFITFLSCDKKKKISEAERNAIIEKKITQDACVFAVLTTNENMESLRDQYAEKVTMSQTITNYVNVAREGDFKDCEEKFKLQFFAYLDSWEEMTKITDNYPNKRGALHILFEEIEKGKDSTAFKKQLEKMRAEWNKVETIVSKK